MTATTACTGFDQSLAVLRLVDSPIRVSRNQIRSTTVPWPNSAARFPYPYENRYSVSESQLTSHHGPAMATATRPALTSPHQAFLSRPATTTPASPRAGANATAMVRLIAMSAMHAP